MNAEQFEQLYILLLCLGLVICFGLGAIVGGQR
ncbi:MULTISPECIES: tail virion protein G7P-2 [unclassified Providencia]|nr:MULTISPECIES: tail virion protein G7P-2 [unclassified Providencia]